MSGIMGCGAHCRELWTPAIIRPKNPPRSGWRLIQLPETLRAQYGFAWESRRKTTVESGHAAVEEAVGFLRVNGLPTTTELRIMLQDAANEQYCASDPNRCNAKAKISKAQAARKEQAKVTARTQMMWAGGFWITTNILAAGNFPNPGQVFGTMANYALELLSTPAGCEHCRGHWERILDYAPPEQKILSMDHARVWLWRVHNATREDKDPTPFKKVAIAWKWPVLSDEQVSALTHEMNIVLLP